MCATSASDSAAKLCGRWRPVPPQINDQEGAVGRGVRCCGWTECSLRPATGLFKQSLHTGIIFSYSEKDSSHKSGDGAGLNQPSAPAPRISFEQGYLTLELLLVSFFQASDLVDLSQNESGRWRSSSGDIAVRPLIPNALIRGSGFAGNPIHFGFICWI